MDHAYYIYLIVYHSLSLSPSRRLLDVRVSLVVSLFVSLSQTLAYSFTFFSPFKHFIFFKYFYFRKLNVRTITRNHVTSPTLQGLFALYFFNSAAVSIYETAQKK